MTNEDWLIGGSITGTTQDIPCVLGILEEFYITIIAGKIGDHIILEKDSDVNHQIVIHLVNYINLGCMGLAHERGIQLFHVASYTFETYSLFFSATLKYILFVVEIKVWMVFIGNES